MSLNFCQSLRSTSVMYLLLFSEKPRASVGVIQIGRWSLSNLANVCQRKDCARFGETIVKSIADEVPCVLSCVMEPSFNK